MRVSSWQPASQFHAQASYSHNTLRPSGAPVGRRRSQGLLKNICSFGVIAVSSVALPVAPTAAQEMGLEDFVFGAPAQIALLGIQFQWTADTQAALAAAKADKGAMVRNLKKTDALLR